MQPLFEHSARAAEFEYPLALAVADAETLYVIDRNLPGVWLVKRDQATQYFGASKKFRTPLNAPRCAAIDADGKLIVGDSSTREVYRFDSAGEPKPLTSGGIGIPMGIGVLSSGELLVVDLELHRIWRVPSSGGIPELFAEVPSPRSIFIDSQDRAWVVSHGKDQLVRLDKDGASATIVSGKPSEFPSSVVVHQDNIAYVCDTYAKAIWRVEADKPPTKWASGQPLSSPVGLALRDNAVLVADPRAKGIFQIDADGKIAKLPIQIAP